MISIKTAQEIEIMKEGGKILAKIMQELMPFINPGATTKEIDKAAEAFVFKYKVEPAFKDYEGFPAVSCVSVNNIVVHAVPSNYILKPGDVVSLDIGIKHKEYFTDMAETIQIPVQGEKPADFYETARMLKVCKKALKLGIAKAKIGNSFGDIGNTIQRFVEYQGFGIVRELCGHGIGKHLHEDPKIPNYAKRRSGEKIKQGMVFCIEPMITMGDWHLKKSKDGYGYETQDGSLSCHFEHTVVISKSEAEIITKI